MTTQSGDAGRGRGVQVIAHRGASAAHPENTLAAFVGAARLGADWVELDVRRTVDGAVVVHHDPVLADGRPIITTAQADLPPQVPTLDAALAVCAEHGLGVNVEIKSNPRDPDHDPDHPIVAGVLTRLAGGPGPYLVTSFDPSCLDAVRMADASIATGQLGLVIDDGPRFVAAAVAAGHVAVNPWAPLVDGPMVAAAHSAGLAVYPWTVDEPDQLRALLDLEVDGIITNVPDRLRALLA